MWVFCEVTLTRDSILNQDGPALALFLSNATEPMERVNMQQSIRARRLFFSQNTFGL
jgi:hypothetical protein